MERLTKRMCGGIGVMPGYELSTVKGMKAVVDRLAAYEGTGLEPEEIMDFVEKWKQAVELAGLCKQNDVDRIKELLQAEKDGRLVVLPVKEGTKIYQLDYRLGGTYKIEERFFSLTYFRHECFGKTLFLTRAEAEAALKKREEADNETD